MDKFYEVFKTRPVVLPVIHVVDREQAIENILIAREGGSDGVFLINHEMTGKELFLVYELIISEFSDFWVGINCLGFGPGEIFGEVFLRGLLNLAGIWTDNAMIDEYSQDQLKAERINRLRELSGFNGLYFGGTAFKYQRKVYNIEKVAQIAAKYMDVVTTSGSATGQAADIEKIRRMKSAIGEKPLAIASGITPENVRDYLGISDCFLVATGIGKNFTTLDLNKLKMLMRNAGRQ